jgi:hypothetical protein
MIWGVQVIRPDKFAVFFGWISEHQWPQEARRWENHQEVHFIIDASVAIPSWLACTG